MEVAKICGIFGIVDFNGELMAGEINHLFEIGIQTLEHRGPDEKIVVQPGTNLVLGMQRLAIQNKSKGLYPIKSADEQVISVFNGEIYNHTNLEKFLTSKGRKFDKGSDGACLSEGFEYLGNSLVDLLDGMFAIAFWNTKSLSLTLTRDHLGIKPLYYFFEKNLLIFSSEPKSILALRNSPTFSRSFKLNLNFGVIENLAHFMFAPGNTESFSNEIKQVAPGEILTFSERGLKSALSNNLGLSQRNKISDLTAAVDAVETELINSIGRHLVSDVPIALALSGGIDSSMIAEISKTEFDRPLDSFCISFIDDRRSENKQAQLIAKRFCNSFTVVEIDPKFIAEDFDTQIRLFENLSTLDGGLISNALMARSMSHHGFKVALFGEGADEMFGGYTWFQLNEGIFKTFPLIIKKQIYLYAITRDPKLLLGMKRISSKNSFANILEFIQDFEISAQLPQHLLKKVDSATMAASVEGRVPYLDGELYRLQTRIHASLKSSMPKFGFLPDSSRTKPILRGLYSRRIGQRGEDPPSKKGFQLPLDTLTNMKLGEIQDLMASTTSLSRVLLSPREFRVLQNLKKNEMSDSDSWKLWRILILEKWNELVWLP